VSCGFYLKSLDIDHTEVNTINSIILKNSAIINVYIMNVMKILQEISKNQKLRTSGIENMKKLCKFLFPIDNLGSTIARIVEILLDSKNKEIYINKLGMVFIC
jgi:hypothetical protein